LTDLEKIAADLIAIHPEYHSMLDQPDVHTSQDFAEAGDVNPFLHLSLHLAVAEQLAIDQPAGIGAAFVRLRATRGDEHAALHALVECLAEVVWHAQRYRTPPDGTLYLECLKRQT